MNRFFTSESVTEGHPDKVCDQIADAILDAILAEDENAHVACECCCTRDFLLIMGEVTAKAKVDFEAIARKKIEEIGYTESGLGFDYKTVKIDVRMNVQSSDIAQGVNGSMEYSDTNEEFDKVGAGDQGLMFGYAGNETEEKMPLAIILSHKICKKLSEVRKKGELTYLRPDGKAQVTVEYDDEGKIVRVDTVVLSTQHNESVTVEKLREDIKRTVILPVVGSYMDEKTKVFINPTGRFVIGGPAGDSGLTGRKIIVDTYGGFVAHGGGSFSGKDPTKVDRSATYYARYVAKNLVAAGVCDHCELQVSYAIGRATPVSIDVRTDGTGIVSDERITEIVKKVFDFRPLAIIRGLKLNAPQYGPTAAYGHFGNPEYAWEKIDKVEEIKKLLQ